MNQPNSKKRHEELLAEECVFGLAEQERIEFETLRDDTSAKLTHEYESTAAAYYLAAAATEQKSMPPASRAAVLERLNALINEADASTQMAAAPATLAVTENRSAASSAAASKTPLWLAALAASLVIGFLLGGPSSDTDVVTETPQQVANVIDASQDAVRLVWTATDDPAAAEADGRVVWSDAAQRGYMAFTGLPVNDPSVEQYQLWIFDAERNDQYPVDGGVFDIASDTGEVIVPIDAKIDVNKAVMFAVTIEKPGGVVVSDRTRLPLLAKLDG